MASKNTVFHKFSASHKTLNELENDHQQWSGHAEDYITPSQNNCNCPTNKKALCYGFTLRDKSQGMASVIRCHQMPSKLNQQQTAAFANCSTKVRPELKSINNLIKPLSTT